MIFIPYYIHSEFFLPRLILFVKVIRLRSLIFKKNNPLSLKIGGCPRDSFGEDLRSKRSKIVNR